VSSQRRGHVYGLRDDPSARTPFVGEAVYDGNKVIAKGLLVSIHDTRLLLAGEHDFMLRAMNVDAEAGTHRTGLDRPVLFRSPSLHPELSSWS
jgi:hypothetical protein